MTERITIKHLNAQLRIIGKLMNIPVKGEFTKRGAKNLYKRDWLDISQSYGGFMPVLVHKEGGGESFLTPMTYHGPAREAYTYMRGFIAGMEAKKRRVR